MVYVHSLTCTWCKLCRICLSKFLLRFQTLSRCESFIYRSPRKPDKCEMKGEGFPLNNFVPQVERIKVINVGISQKLMIPSLFLFLCSADLIKASNAVIMFCVHYFGSSDNIYRYERSMFMHALQL